MIICLILYILFAAATTAQQPGYLDNDGKFTLIPEMIPEFVVPDLTDFKVQCFSMYIGRPSFFVISAHLQFVQYPKINPFLQFVSLLYP